jgi:hypothetical protein
MHLHQIRKEIVMSATRPCAVMLAEASVLSMRIAVVAGAISGVS